MASKGGGALIIGAGEGLSAAVARACQARGMPLMLAARDTGKLNAQASELGADVCACDVADAGQVAELFAQADARIGTPALVLYNPSRRVRGGIAELDPEAVHDALMVTCYGGFLVGREASRRMLDQGHGSIFFTGASASVKGYPGSAVFAMGKFALRGLAQSMARELGPKNIHVAHFVIDGGIAGKGRDGGEVPDSLLDADAIAETYLHVHQQPRSAWSDEIALRPWVERW
jgi:NAD(P)-dependent dehydrogenase (short-subunit alcohol dehydrogenase family)